MTSELSLNERGESLCESWIDFDWKQTKLIELHTIKNHQKPKTNGCYFQIWHNLHQRLPTAFISRTDIKTISRNANLNRRNIKNKRLFSVGSNKSDTLRKDRNIKWVRSQIIHINRSRKILNGRARYTGMYLRVNSVGGGVAQLVRAPS